MRRSGLKSVCAFRRVRDHDYLVHMQISSTLPCSGGHDNRRVGRRRSHGLLCVAATSEGDSGTTTGHHLGRC